MGEIYGPPSSDGQLLESQEQKSQAGIGHTARKERQMEGIRKARQRGVAFGRRHALTEGQRRKIALLAKESNLSIQQIADAYAVSRGTIYRAIKKACEGVDPPQAMNAQGAFPIYNAYR